MQIDGTTLRVCERNRLSCGYRFQKIVICSHRRELSASDAKSLRVCLSSFFDLALVVTKSLQEVTFLQQPPPCVMTAFFGSTQFGPDCETR